MQVRVTAHGKNHPKTISASRRLAAAWRTAGDEERAVAVEKQFAEQTAGDTTAARDQPPAPDSPPATPPN